MTNISNLQHEKEGISSRDEEGSIHLKLVKVKRKRSGHERGPFSTNSKINSQLFDNQSPLKKISQKDEVRKSKHSKKKVQVGLKMMNLSIFDEVKKGNAKKSTHEGCTRFILGGGGWGSLTGER